MNEQFERLTVGSFTITPLLDGMFPIGFDVMPQADCERGRQLLEIAGRPSTEPSIEPVYAFLVEQEGRRILIDTGCGQLFGPALGNVPDKLEAAGVTASRVETIVLTHMHPDHIGGLVLENGEPRFANSELVVTEEEVKYWLDARSREASPPAFGVFFDAAAKVLEAYGSRVRYLDGAGPITNGMTAVSLPGHTPGHIGVMLEDQHEKLLIWGDIIHCATLQLAQPEWPIAFDVDPDQAAATRSALFRTVAEDDLRVLGMHLGGSGYLKRDGHGYNFFASGTEALTRA